MLAFLCLALGVFAALGFYFFLEKGCGGSLPAAPPLLPSPFPHRPRPGGSATHRGLGAARKGQGKGLPAACPRLCPQPPGLPLASGRAGSRSRGAGGRRGPAQACAAWGCRPGAGGRHLRGGGEGWSGPRQQGGTAPGGCSQHSWGRSLGVYVVLFFFSLFVFVCASKPF